MNYLSGNSRIETVDKLNWGAKTVSGTFNTLNNIFTFQETKIDSQVIVGSFFWCLANGTLVYDNIQEKIYGSWSANWCTPGTIELWRLKVVSDTVFCQFDRWGTLVFSTDSPLACWNGENQGRKCDVGVYIFLIEIETEFCGKSIIKGDVTLVR